MVKRNDQMTYKETLRAAHAAAKEEKPSRLVDAIDMGETSGGPRFTSRFDGAERGIVENGIQKRSL